MRSFRIIARCGKVGKLQAKAMAGIGNHGNEVLSGRTIDSPIKLLPAHVVWHQLTVTRCPDITNQAFINLY